MTYPEISVSEAIGRLTAPYQLDNTVDSNQPLLDRYRHVWTPDLRILDTDGTELYRWNGYLPPAEFAPQLIAAVAHARLRRKEYGKAQALYEEVLRRFPTSLIAAEAEYYDKVRHNIGLLTLEQTLTHGGNFGSVDQIVDTLGRLATELGVNHYISWFRIPSLDRKVALKAMETFATEVIPQLRDLEPRRVAASV